MLGSLLTLSACKLDSERVSQESRLFLQKEASLFTELSALNEQQKNEASSDAEDLKSSALSSQKIEEYLSFMSLLEKALLTPFKRVTLKEIKEALYKEDKEVLKKLRSQWPELHHKLITSFIRRNAEFNLEIPSWDYKNLHIRYPKDKIEISLPKNQLEILLGFFFLPEKIPSVDFSFSINIHENTRFLDTRPDCLSLLPELDDENCQEDARALCGHQMDLKKVSLVIDEFKRASCREEKSSYFISREDTLSITYKKGRSLDSFRLREALIAAIATEPVLKP
ncbi:MAG: hypothetical protein R3A80_00400 [Bdellovibrionota bacterium]